MSTTAYDDQFAADPTAAQAPAKGADVALPPLPNMDIPSDSVLSPFGGCVGYSAKAMVDYAQSAVIASRNQANGGQRGGDVEVMRLALERISGLRGTAGFERTSFMNEVQVFANEIARAAMAAHKPDGGDAKDAERYRWLRVQPFEVWKRIAWNTWADDPAVATHRDAAIDAAIAQQRQEG